MEQLSGEQITRLFEEWDGFRSRMLAFMRDYDIILCPVDHRPAGPQLPRALAGDAEKGDISTFLGAADPLRFSVIAPRVPGLRQGEDWHISRIFVLPEICWQHARDAERQVETGHHSHTSRAPAQNGAGVSGCLELYQSGCLRTGQDLQRGTLAAAGVSGGARTLWLVCTTGLQCAPAGGRYL